MREYGSVTIRETHPVREWEVLDAPRVAGFSTEILSEDLMSEDGSKIRLKGYVYKVVGYDWLGRCIIGELVSRP
jgi:hypothetical protein